MAGMHKLIAVAGSRSDGALATWQRLKAQCDDALRKLSLLKQHRERYRDLLNANLGEGMPAVSMMAYLGFIGQIDRVVLRQESEVGRLEAGRVGPPGGKLFEIQREQAQHVDHGGFADQIDRASGVLRLALGEERKPTPIEQRRA